MHNALTDIAIQRVQHLIGMPEASGADATGPTRAPAPHATSVPCTRALPITTGAGVVCPRIC